jgi:hypothetical protein
MSNLAQIAIQNEQVPISQSPKSVVCVFENGKLVWKNSCKNGCRGNKGLQLEGIQRGIGTIPTSYSLSCKSCGSTFNYFGWNVPREVRAQFNEYLAKNNLVSVTVF